MLTHEMLLRLAHAFSPAPERTPPATAPALAAFVRGACRPLPALRVPALPPTLAPAAGTAP